MPEPGTNLTIDPQRLWDQIMETARFGGTAKGLKTAAMLFI